MRFTSTVKRLKNDFRALRKGAILIFLSAAPYLTSAEEIRLPRTVFGDPIRPLGDVRQQSVFFREILPTSLTSYRIDDPSPAPLPMRYRGTPAETGWLKAKVGDDYLCKTASLFIIADRIDSVGFDFGQTEEIDAARRIYDGFIGVLGQPDEVEEGFRAGDMRYFNLRWRRARSTVTLYSEIILSSQPWLTISGSVRAPSLKRPDKSKLIQLRGARLRSRYAHWLKRCWTPKEAEQKTAKSSR